MCNFMVFLKTFILLIQTLLTLNFLSYDLMSYNSHDNRNNKTIASIAKHKYKTGNCYVYINPPPSYRSAKSPSTREVSTIMSHASRSSPTASRSLVRGSSSDSTKASTIASISAS